MKAAPRRGALLSAIRLTLSGGFGPFDRFLERVRLFAGQTQTIDEKGLLQLCMHSLFCIITREEKNEEHYRQ